MLVLGGLWTPSGGTPASARAVGPAVERTPRPSIAVARCARVATAAAITRGTINWPVPGHVTSRFGPRASPSGPGREAHPGIDIRGRRGAAVGAAAAGRVTFAGLERGYGRTVVIDHGRGVATLYAHLDAFAVHSGEHVGRGQRIGALGASGRTTGSHLHFEVRVGDVPVDPTCYLAPRWSERG
ncbi:MAG TPA: M23 family metallopeptidase [Candidatus Binatia bacterium]|nr:M23 family metallopeptidase [Candidatus Binatia bacterium]